MARLNREDWVDAAYELFQNDGLAAVRVEVLARSLGTTKGSFYWHFTDRRDLLLAVLAKWQELETERVIAEVTEDLAPGERLAVLMREIAHHTALRTGERTLYVDAQSQGVAEAVVAVTERRVGFIESLLTELGLPADEARRRATVIVSCVLGYQQMTASPWESGIDPYDLVETLFHRAIDGTTAESDARLAWSRHQPA